MTSVILQWIVSLYGKIKEMAFILEVEVMRISTNEELKLQFRNEFQQLCLPKDATLIYPGLWNIVRKFLIASHFHTW